jgi:hypothetical protein
MDQVNSSSYSTLVKQALAEYKTSFVANSLDPLPYELTLVFDDEHQQYIVRSVGWQKNKRILTTILHVAIRNGKIWIEEDWTEEGIATYFLDHGVPNDHIVLGFHAPTMRPYTEFAVA